MTKRILFPKRRPKKGKQTLDLRNVKKGFQASIFIKAFICHSEVYSTELIQQTVQRLPFHAFVWAPAANQSTAISTRVRQFGCCNINHNEEKHNLCLNKQHSRNLFFLFDNNVCLLIKVFSCPSQVMENKSCVGLVTTRCYCTDPPWLEVQLSTQVQRGHKLTENNFILCDFTLK